jgi:hypothetical protein
MLHMLLKECYIECTLDHPLALVTLQVTGALRGKLSPVKYMVAATDCFLINSKWGRGPGPYPVGPWGLDFPI